MTLEELLDKEGFIAYTFKGVSMMPFLKEDKDIVIINKPDNNNYSKYDIVLYKRDTTSEEKQYVLHRILKDNKDGTYWIIGDNTYSGETVNEDDIIGILSEIRRENKIIKTKGLLYKLYVYTWCKHYNIRFLIMRIKGKILRTVKQLNAKISNNSFNLKKYENI